MKKIEKKLDLGRDLRHTVFSGEERRNKGEKNMTRTDIHRPSAINPDEYQFVSFGNQKLEGFSDCATVNVEREILEKHMAETGGDWSRHQHGGNCHVCGAHCIYTVIFYHPESNSYIRTGGDCAENMEFRDMNAFRRACKHYSEHKAGRMKAEGILEEKGLQGAWDLFANQVDKPQWEENTIVDIVGKLVKYGSASEKQFNFIGNLLDKIEKRAEIAEARAAETAAASPVPVTDERMLVEGTVLTVKGQDTDFGYVVKCLVQHESGYKVWGTVPNPIFDDVEPGAVISFMAKVEVSKDDEKFGFYKRPTKPQVIKAATEEG